MTNNQALLKVADVGLIRMQARWIDVSLRAKNIQGRNSTPNAQKPKESEKKCKLNPTGSQRSKQKKQNLVIKSKGHFCDGFAGRGSGSESKGRSWRERSKCL